jgi:hypothetical protein
VLPDWLAPAAVFSLRCRQQAFERIAAGHPLEQAAPHCRDLSRSPDPTTLRRWAYRRLCSIACWLRMVALSGRFFRLPTILAWDFGVAGRILPFEARSP